MRPDAPVAGGKPIGNLRFLLVALIVLYFCSKVEAVDRGGASRTELNDRRKMYMYSYNVGKLREDF